MRTEDNDPARIKYHAGVSLNQTNLEEKYDAIVIGSGIGGLATAAALAKVAQKRVLVLEQHYRAGGFTHEFCRGAYSWDVGLHYVGEVQQPGMHMRRLFDSLTNGKLKWHPTGNVYDQIIIGDNKYDFIAGSNELQEQLHTYFPNDTTAIRGYFKCLHQTLSSRNHYFMEKALPTPIAYVVGGWLRHGINRYAKHTTGSQLNRLTSNKRLQSVLAGQYGNYGLPPNKSSFFAHTTIASHYLEGASYPIGGASQIALGMESVIEASGGKIVTSAKVDKVLIENNRAVGVRLKQGTTIEAPLVISNMGVRETLDKVVPEDLGMLMPLRKVVQKLEPSTAHTVLYVGLNKDAKTLGLTGSNLWIYRDEHHDLNYDAFLEDINVSFPGLYVSSPSAKDPSFSAKHPGRATIEVIVPTAYKHFVKWQNEPWQKRSSEYTEFKEQLKQRLTTTLIEHLPHLSRAIDYTELSTPLSSCYFTGHIKGQSYGLAATPARFAARELRPESRLPGLYFTGADIAMLGIVGSLMSGMLTASSILGKNVQKFL